MRIGAFSVQVPEGQETSGGFVRMQHNTRYTLKLGNHGSRRVDANVVIDGKFMGLFRLDPGTVFPLRRPSHDESFFTFMKRDSQEGGDAGLGGVSKNDLGLVIVTFKPEKDRPASSYKSISRSDDRFGYSKGNLSLDDMPERTSGGPPPVECRARGEEYTTGAVPMSRGFGFASPARPPRDVEAGGTGLTGHCDDKFINVPELDYDPTLELTIQLRLCADKAVRPLTEAPRGNPTPAAVE